ncbi:MAG: hypothetical protein JWL58_1206, partial [Streptosporangiaceae bacterium]|nr:hypothetical protein [Streptosporangiaceae bacterium]
MTAHLRDPSAHSRRARGCFAIPSTGMTATE